MATEDTHEFLASSADGEGSENSPENPEADQATADTAATEETPAALPNAEAPLLETSGDAAQAQPDVSATAVEEEPPAQPKAASVTPRAVPDRAQLKWYVVHTYSGFEFKAKQALEERVRQHNFSDYFGEVRVPQETVIELVRGQKKTSSRKFFPGYILVQMILNQDTWHLVKETPKVTGFVGDASDPAPLGEDEVARIIAQVEEGASAPRSRVSFSQGDPVKVIDGPFTDFNGTIEEVKPDKGKLKVLISIFGRATPVELDFIQVEKL
jgi:transcriptional antiterminator NusG